MFHTAVGAKLHLGDLAPSPCLGRHCIQSVLLRFTRFPVVVVPWIFICWGYSSRVRGTEVLQWDPEGLGTKSRRCWSSLQTLFTDFDCRNDQNL